MLTTHVQRTYTFLLVPPRGGLTLPSSHLSLLLPFLSSSPTLSIDDRNNSGSGCYVALRCHGVRYATVSWLELRGLPSSNSHGERERERTREKNRTKFRTVRIYIHIYIYIAAQQQNITQISRKTNVDLRRRFDASVWKRWGNEAVVSLASGSTRHEWHTTGRPWTRSKRHTTWTQRRLRRLRAAGRALRQPVNDRSRLFDGPRWRSTTRHTGRERLRARRSKMKMYHLWAQKQQLSAVYRGGG